MKKGKDSASTTRYLLLTTKITTPVPRGSGKSAANAVIRDAMKLELLKNQDYHRTKLLSKQIVDIIYNMRHVNSLNDETVVCRSCSRETMI